MQFKSFQSQLFRVFRCSSHVYSSFSYFSFLIFASYYFMFFYEKDNSRKSSKDAMRVLQDWMISTLNFVALLSRKNNIDKMCIILVFKPSACYALGFWLLVCVIFVCNSVVLSFCGSHFSVTSFWLVGNVLEKAYAAETCMT